MRRVVIAPLALLLLSACGGAKYQDLDSFMKDAERNVTKHLEPLPAQSPPDIDFHKAGSHSPTLSNRASCKCRTPPWQCLPSGNRT